MQTLAKAIWFNQKDPCLNVKDEGANLNTMVVTLNSIANFEILGVMERF
jgi:hypothetical protein